MTPSPSPTEMRKESNYVYVGNECCKKCLGHIIAKTTTYPTSKPKVIKTKIPQCKNVACECHTTPASTSPTEQIKKIEKLKFERVGAGATFPEGSTMITSRESSGLATEADFPLARKINEIIDYLNTHKK
jgi:hypothetical protein